LTAYNGPISLVGVGGDVRARTTNGPLDIELVGTRWEGGGGLDAETTNGPVSLAIPDNYSAELEFGTVNGPMTVGFPLTVTIQGKVGRRIITKLGAGGAPIRAVTTNGPVEIRRNSPPSPAVGPAPQRPQVAHDREVSERLAGVD